MGRVGVIVVLAAGVALAGCGEYDYDLAPVSGVVTLDDKPLVNGVVNFQPIGGENANPGPGSTGITDAQGRFKLATQTADGIPGAVVGTHKVRIYSRNPEGPPTAEDVDPQPVVELVPMRYNHRTELTYTVPVGGTNQADFKLTAEEG